MTITKKRAVALLEKWKPKLRLTDWDIDISVVARRTLGGDDGECQSWQEIKEASIKIVRTTPSSAFLDHETLIVHEMLHCHFPTEGLDAKNEAIIEQGVDQLSKALVAEDRRKNDGTLGEGRASRAKKGKEAPPASDSGGGNPAGTPGMEEKDGSREVVEGRGAAR